MHVFSFTFTVIPLAKAFLFLLFCMKFPGRKRPVSIGSLAVFATEAPTHVLPAIHSPSCSEHFLSALSGKLRLLKCAGCQHLHSCLLVQHLCPHGSITVTTGPNRVDVCMLDGCTPFLSMAALQVRCVYSKDKFAPNLFSQVFCKCFLEQNNKTLKNAKSICEALYNKIRNVSLWCGLFFFL